MLPDAAVVARATCAGAADPPDSVQPAATASPTASAAPTAAAVLGKGMIRGMAVPTIGVSELSTVLSDRISTGAFAPRGSPSGSVMSILPGAYGCREAFDLDGSGPACLGRVDGSASCQAAPPWTPGPAPAEAAVHGDRAASLTLFEVVNSLEGVEMHVFAGMAAGRGVSGRRSRA